MAINGVSVASKDAKPESILAECGKTVHFTLRAPGANLGRGTPSPPRAHISTKVSKKLEPLNVHVEACMVEHSPEKL